MAIVMRRYQDVGATSNADLAAFVNPTTPPTIAAQYPRVTVDINYDNAVPGIVADLDDYLATLDLVPTATASPKQVFQYTAVGGEGAAFTIDASKGFVPRVSNEYVVQITLRRPAANGLKITSVVDGTFTTVQFGVELSAPIEVGDILCFTVEDRT